MMYLNFNNLKVHPVAHCRILDWVPAEWRRLGRENGRDSVHGPSQRCMLLRTDIGDDGMALSRLKTNIATLIRHQYHSHYLVLSGNRTTQQNVKDAWQNGIYI